MIIYLESSAATKLLLREPETPAMRDFLNGFAAEGHAVVSSQLVETELRRAAQRAGASQAAATAVLDRLDLLDVDRSTFAAAGLLPDPLLRSLDALHVASAMRVSADIFVTYDDRQTTAAHRAGLHVVSPV